MFYILSGAQEVADRSDKNVRLVYVGQVAGVLYNDAPRAFNPGNEFSFSFPHNVPASIDNQCGALHKRQLFNYIIKGTGDGALQCPFARPRPLTVYPGQTFRRHLGEAHAGHMFSSLRDRATVRACSPASHG